jgi:methionine synthase II (cobalamin-independent)
VNSSAAPSVSPLPDVQGAHLVGSVNLPDAETVFRAVAGHLGDRLHRIPDGEVGERFYWIQFQKSRFDTMPGLSRVPTEPFYIRGIFDGRPFFIEDGFDIDDLQFPDLGYAAGALESYATFARLRTEGVIPAGTRFQVSLPTPAAIAGSFFVAEDRAAFEAAYERALFAELDRILDGIPHDDLAIQWDTALEFALLESANIRSTHAIAPWFDDVLGGVIERAARQAAVVPADVQVGYHLCYGDVEEAHFVQPKDAGHLADVVAGTLARTSRPIDWFHLPVPIERDDTEFFAPLADVDIPASTELYLGLLHHEDGVEGASRRISAASSAVARFGVATECGFGRGPSERTPELLELHSAVARAW